MKTHSKKTIAVITLCIFVFLEYFSDQFLQPLGQYTQYIAEFVFSLGALFLVGNYFAKKDHNRKTSFLALAIALVTGLGVRLLASPLGLPIPFDLGSAETLLFLLLIGPILEELLYRGVLIEALSNIKNSPVAIMLVSALLFSLSHYRVINSVPAELKSFVHYQTIYTFALGLICAWLRLQGGFIWAAGAHLLFNLGFYVGGF